MTARLTKFLNCGALNEALKKQLTNELNFVNLIINLLPSLHSLLKLSAGFALAALTD